MKSARLHARERSRIATPSPAEPSLFDLTEDGPPDEELAA
jgi:hypothetical protein